MFTLSKSLQSALFRAGYILTRIPVRGLKLTLLGAMNPVGQALALLLKRNTHLKEIAIQDRLFNIKGLGMELKAINLGGEVTCYEGSDELNNALKDANIVIIAGGNVFFGNGGEMPTNEFEENCKTVIDFSYACSKFCPNACICVVTCPQNSTVPIAVEIFKNVHFNCRRKVFGINTYQAMRASQIFTEFMDLNPTSVSLNTIGGCSRETTVPMLSSMENYRSLPFRTAILLLKKIQEKENHNAQKKSNDLSLSYAYSIDRFIDSLCRALKGERDIIETVFVQCDQLSRYSFCSMPLELGPMGIKTLPRIPDSMSNYELSLLISALNKVEKEVTAGLGFYRHHCNVPEKQKQPS